MKTLDERRLERDGEWVTMRFLICQGSGDMISEINAPEWVHNDDLKLCLRNLMERLDESA